MLKQLRIFLARAIAAVWMVAPATAANATVIEFNDLLATCADQVTSYTEAGVTFSNPGGLVGRTRLSTSGGGGVLSCTTPLTPIRADFTTPFTGIISITAGDESTDSDLIFISAYDAAGALIEFQTGLLASTGMLTVTTGRVADAAFLILGSISGINGSSVVIESVSLVTEPAMFTLICLSLAGLAFTRRRKR